MAVCLSNLYTSVEIGHVLVVSLKLFKHFKLCTIEFTNEIDEVKNVPLSIQVEETRIKFSCYSNGEKAGEEEMKIKKIQTNEFITFYILTLDDKFRIALNDDHLCSFNYRCDINFIKAVRILGDVKRVRQVDHRKVYPVVWPPNQDTLKTIAFSSDVPCKYTENTIIILRMTLTGEEGSFFIRFNELETSKQLFHFNPRFEERVIVVNSMNDKLEWLPELRWTEFPLVMNKPFQLAIFMDSSFFQVAINGKHLLKYPFKMVRSTGLRTSRCHPIYDKMAGLKMFAHGGMKLNVSYVDFFNIQKNDSKFYEIYSDINFM